MEDKPQQLTRWELMGRGMALGETVISGGAIAIRGNSIAWIGKATDAAKLFTSRDTLNASGLIAMPGLTDTHYHTAQQFLRGVWKVTHRRGPR